MTVHIFFPPSELGRGFLRRLALASCCALVSHVGFSQQTPSRPKKVLTPEQQAVQQEMRDVDMRRNNLRGRAKQAFDGEMARQKAGDCPDANNTYQFNVCFGQATIITDQNLKTYEGAIRDLLGLHDPSLATRPPMPGPGGPALTSEQAVAEFDHVEELWHSYSEAATTAAFHQFGGGTGGPSFQMEMHLRLVRSHMTELNEIYGMLLRH